MGAHAAHGLEKYLSEQGIEASEITKRLDQCEIAVRYHLVHAVALLAVGLSLPRPATKRKNLAAIFLALGIGLFCGGLYSMVYLGEMGHWAIVPSGGLCFMIGWLVLALAALTDNEQY